MHKFEFELSELENKVIACVLLSRFNKEMEHLLEISEYMVKRIISFLCRITNAGTKTKLYKWALRNGFTVNEIETEVYFRGELVFAL